MGKFAKLDLTAPDGVKFESLLQTEIDALNVKTHAQLGSTINLDTSNFNKNLSPTETTAQKAFDKLDDLDLSTVNPTNIYFVSSAFAGKSSPYFSDLNACLIAVANTNSLIQVYPGIYSVRTNFLGVNVKGFGAVTINIGSYVGFNDSKIDGVYLNISDNISLNTTDILNCNANSMPINCVSGNCKFNCPSTNALVITVNGAIVTGLIDNLASITVGSGYAYLNINNACGNIIVNASGTLKIFSANTATYINSAGNFYGKIRNINLANRMISTSGNFKLENSVVSTTTAGPAINQNGGDVILNGVRVNASNGGYGAALSGHSELHNCRFKGFDANGNSIYCGSGTLLVASIFEGKINGTGYGSIASGGGIITMVNDIL